MDNKQAGLSDKQYHQSVLGIIEISQKSVAKLPVYQRKRVEIIELSRLLRQVKVEAKKRLGTYEFLP